MTVTASTKTDPTTPSTPYNTASTTVSATSSGTAIPALTYDEAGNMLTDGTRTYEWDADNQLVAIIYSGTGNRTEFTYDGKGRRVREIEKTGEAVTNTKVLIWDGPTITEEHDTTNAVAECFYSQGEKHHGASDVIYRRAEMVCLVQTVAASSMTG